MERKFEHLYNDEDDILSIYDSKIKAIEFVEFSDFLDVGFSKDGGVCSLEISDTVNFFKAINKGINKDFLNDLNLVKIRQILFRGVFILVLILASNEGKMIEQSLPPLFKNEYESPLVSVLKN